MPARRRGPTFLCLLGDLHSEELKAVLEGGDVGVGLEARGAPVQADLELLDHLRKFV